MAKGEFVGEFMMIALAAGAINSGIAALFEYNIIQTFIPSYAKWIIVGIGGIGAWLLYARFKT